MTYDELLGYFVHRVDEIVHQLGSSVIHWEEVFTAGAKVAADTIFQVWTDSSKVSLVTAANYRAIASPSNFWYLNYPTNTWDVIYEYDPYIGINNIDQQALIIGGEIALWGEYVDDMNIETSIYPRAAAAGERLWSPATVTDKTDALNRLMIQRCWLISRGFASSPIQPADYCHENYV